MPKSIDKETLRALLATSTKTEIAEQFGITAKSVTRLVRQYGLVNVRPSQSIEARRKRAEANKQAHTNDPTLTERKTVGLKAHREKIKGKLWEEVYTPEQVTQMKEAARQRLLGKPGLRKPRSGPKLCTLCESPVESGKGKKTQAYCKACMSGYFKAYYQHHREHYRQVTNQNRRERIAEWREYLAELKQRPCTDCGKTYPPFCLDFDHLESGHKVAAIPVLIVGNAAKSRVLAELEKTEVVCANCHRAREHARYLQTGKLPVHLSPRQRRNKEIIEQAKSRPCQDCGGTFSHWQMDFDHVSGDKLASVGRLVMSASTEALLAEIEKCEVVCAVCHRLRTFEHKRPKEEKDA